MDPAIGRARAARDHCQRPWGETIDPLAGGDRLPGRNVGSHRRPVPLLLDGLVRDRALDHENEGVELTVGGRVPRLDELLAVLECEDRVVEVDLGQTGNRSEEDVLDAGLGGCGDRYRITIAP